MTKIEAPTLADAYEKAARLLDCSITELEYEVIQHPSSGLLGMFRKNAIIVADCNRREKESLQTEKTSELSKALDETIEAIAAEEIMEELLETVSPESSPEAEHSEEREQTPEREPRKQKRDKPEREKHRLDEALTRRDDAVLESFFEHKEPVTVQRPKNNNLELAEKIEGELKALLGHSCFAIDTVEVDVVENTALIFIDGDDAALLIGKEGYRYNALSYMLFNWLHTRYDLYIKLEIAQFLTTQQEMIQNYIKPVIEYVELNGRGKTRPLDGILVQIALEQLREVFPNKYVAVKTGRDGRKFVVINEFNNKRYG